jgi:hypothetical protein
MISISRRLHSSSLPALCLVTGCASLLLGGCGGGGGNNGGGGGGGGTNPTSYTITVASTNPASGVSVSYNLAQPGSDPASGTTPFTVTASSGSTMNFVASSTAGNNNFGSWSGCTSVSGANCSVTVSNNTTITANYTTPVAVAPTVGVTPTPTTITTVQPLSVAVSVVGTNGGATPTGSVVLSSGTYTSAATTLSNGSATINVAAGSLAAGSDTLTATYTPDSASSAAYKSASGTANVTVNALPSPTMSLALSSTGITTAQTLTATVTVGGTPTPTGSVVLTGGGYTSSSTTITGGVAVITVPAGSLAPGTDTLTATYTPDSSSSSTYSSATKTASVTVSYAVIVNSSNPASGVAITVSPNDVNGHGSGSSPISLAYASGATVTLTAPATAANGNTFNGWTGCTSTSGTGTPPPTCTLNVTAGTTLTANYSTPAPMITVSPAGGNVTIGGSQQFTAVVTGLSGNTVTWSVAVASGTGAAGTISSAGLYQTPYPAPTTVTITATSTVSSTVSGSTTVTLVAPTTTAGPAVSVDAGTVTRAISPLIYGVNAYLLDATTAQNTNITLARWGGDDTSRYNYQNNVVNSANDYFFENFSGSNSMLPNGTNGNGTNFNDFMTSANTLGIATIGTAPVLGWVSNSTVKACSFPKSTYPNQASYNGDNCGNGVYPQGTNGCTNASGCAISGNNTVAQVTSVQDAPPSAPGTGNNTPTWAASTWIGGWIDCLTTKGTYCASGPGKDATIWDLDNEPEYWSAVHRDVHPNPMTYDEITNGGIGTALAIKAADPNALTSGPIISGWYQYFYSQQDVNNGYSTSPCFKPWGNPADRTAHGGIPLIEYYLQQMNEASSLYGVRLLDYLDIHTYFAANHNGSSVAFTTAGDSGEQEARMDSTRVFWDSTYTDPALTAPNYTADSGYTSSCSVPLVAPQIIPRIQGWVAADYPGTKTAIDEYNFGGTESINGAVTQADVLGIFGKYGLDMATFWPTAQYAQQIPGNMAFAIYRNYDGSKSTFGDQELSSTTGDQSKLAVYAASRTSDGAVTVVVINKTYGPLTDTLSVNNLTSTATSAQVFQYSNANLTAIVAQPATTITPPASGTTSTLGSLTFPAQSITMIVIPAH